MGRWDAQPCASPLYFAEISLRGLVDHSRTEGRADVAGRVGAALSYVKRGRRRQCLVTKGAHPQPPLLSRQYG